ncbi:response regulator [bacterium]|nr:response regulator [bacterium]
MRILIAEDEFLNRSLLSRFLKKHGEVDTCVDGLEAIASFKAALDERLPYDLLCLDIVMPKMDGIAALKEIRAMEEARGIVIGNDGVKIMMTTALRDSEHVIGAFRGGCEAYLVKPFTEDGVTKELSRLGLLPES